jgi:hypothetical protein
MYYYLRYGLSDFWLFQKALRAGLSEKSSIQTVFVGFVADSTGEFIELRQVCPTDFIGRYHQAQPHGRDMQTDQPESQ